MQDDMLNKDKLDEYKAMAAGKGETGDGAPQGAPGLKGAAAGGDEQIYEVQEGDTLSHIALAVYGNANKWREIVEANKDQIENPSMIRPGQKLRIPKLD